MKEWTRDNLVVDADIQIDDEQENTIVVQLETWFDVDEKFGINTRDDDDMWVNLYAKYNVVTDEISTEFIISNSNYCDPYIYHTTNNEKELIIKLIHEACLAQYGCTPKEFIKKFLNN